VVSVVSEVTENLRIIDTTLKYGVTLNYSKGTYLGNFER
jgi:hypothetical protein